MNHLQQAVGFLHLVINLCYLFSQRTSLQDVSMSMAADQQVAPTYQQPRVLLLYGGKSPSHTPGETRWC